MSTNNALLSAKEFSVFVFNNHTQSNTDCEGAIAVGNTATYSNYSIGNKIAEYYGVSITRNDLVVGEFMDIGDGTNFSGNSIIQSIDKGAVIKYLMHNNNNIYNPITVNCSTSNDCIDFTQTKRDLIELANTIANYQNYSAENHIGTVEILNENPSLSYLKLKLTGTDSNYNVFFIDYGKLLSTYPFITSFNEISIYAPDDSSVIIVVNYVTPPLKNPPTKPITFKDGGIKWNNLTLGNDHSSVENTIKNKHLFWCLPDCTLLTVPNYALAGTILAPNADFNFIGGQANGNIIVNNLYGAGEVNYYLYEGLLPITPNIQSDCTLSGLMWDNFENDGILNSNDAFVPYAIVYLLNSTGNTIAITTTDSNGKYKFSNLSPSTYKVQFTIPKTYTNYRFVTIGNWVNSAGLSPSYTLTAGTNKENVNAPIHIGDFEIHKTAYAENTTALYKGSKINYTISFINFSESAINENIVITDTLNNKTTYNNDAKIYIESSDMTNFNNYFTVYILDSTITFTIAYLAAKTLGTINFSVSLTENLMPGDSITNFASASYNDNTAITEETLVRYNAISIDKYAPNTVLSGSEFNYTLCISNSSTLASNITISDILPSQFRIKNYNPNTKDISSLISIQSGCLNYSDDSNTIPTLSNPVGGISVTNFTATIGENNTITITDLNISGSTYTNSSTISCLSGLIITIPGIAILNQS